MALGLPQTATDRWMAIHDRPERFFVQQEDDTGVWACTQCDTRIVFQAESGFLIADVHREALTDHLRLHLDTLPTDRDEFNRMADALDAAARRTAGAPGSIPPRIVNGLEHDPRTNEAVWHCDQCGHQLRFFAQTTRDFPETIRTSIRQHVNEHSPPPAMAPPPNAASVQDVVISNYLVRNGMTSIPIAALTNQQREVILQNLVPGRVYPIEAPNTLDRGVESIPPSPADNAQALRRSRAWLKRHWPKWRYLRYRLTGSVNMRGPSGDRYSITSDKLFHAYAFQGQTWIDSLCIDPRDVHKSDRVASLVHYIQNDEPHVLKTANVIGRAVTDIPLNHIRLNGVMSRFRFHHPNLIGGPPR